MLIFKKLKGKPTVLLSLLLSAPSFNLANISKANNIVSEETSPNIETQEINSEKIFDLFFEDGSFLEMVNNDGILTINKFDSSNNNILTKEFQNKENYKIETILPIKNYGFIVISKNISMPVISQEDNSESSILTEAEDLFNILAFDKNGELIKDVFTKDISKDYLFKFTVDSFYIINDDIKAYIESLSNEEIYDLSLYLVNIAENTLSEYDINNAKSIIDMISDPIKRDELLLKLNIIASESIEEELENPSFNDTPINNDISYIADSYIDLSINTNNITFDYLNVSQDTTLNEALSLEVSSSLPYDINIIIEGDIKSNTNSTNLSNDVFSVKESSSNDFLTFDDTGVVTVLQNQPQGDFVSHNIDIRLNTSTNIIKDVYKAVFKIEAITR